MFYFIIIALSSQAAMYRPIESSDYTFTCDEWRCLNSCLEFVTVANFVYIKHIKDFTSCPFVWNQFYHIAAAAAMYKTVPFIRLSFTNWILTSLSSPDDIFSVITVTQTYNKEYCDKILIFDKSHI